MLIKLLKDKNGEGYIDTVIIVIAAMLVIALVVKVFPVFIAKNQLNTYASEVVRTAEISGRIGSETSSKTKELNDQAGITPIITWQANYISGTNKVQLNDQMTVTVVKTVDIGFFSFGSFPIELESKATGRSEVYWK
jgi:Flp pilus assembly protein TadG